MSSNQYRFILKPYKIPGDKETCPSCGARRKFVRYIDTHTEELLPEQYGRCDREVSCGYHLSPYKVGYSRLIYEKDKEWGFGCRAHQPTLTPPRPVSYIPSEVFQKSLECEQDNQFIQFLLARFDEEAVKGVKELYGIGTSDVWPGATIFWQQDKAGRIRTGKIMLYNRLTGKRVKEPYDHITFAHSRLQDSREYHLSQCLYGEHLLEQEPEKVVALVESEKTAIIASIYLPGYLWLATGGKGFNDERLQALRGRKVILFPDLSKDGKAFRDWVEKTKRNADLASFVVSDFLEQKATQPEREQGLDLADYLLRVDYRKYRHKRIQGSSACLTSSHAGSRQETAHSPASLPEGTRPISDEKSTITDGELDVGEPSMFDTPTQEQAILDSLIADLDRGKSWELILLHNKDTLPATVTADTLKEYFHRLGHTYLGMLSAAERRDFIRERFRKGGYTHFGILEHYPCLGFSREYEVSEFLK